MRRVGRPVLNDQRPPLGATTAAMFTVTRLPAGGASPGATCTVTATPLPNAVWCAPAGAAAIAARPTAARVSVRARRISHATLLEPSSRGAPQPASEASAAGAG